MSLNLCSVPSPLCPWNFMHASVLELVCCPITMSLKYHACKCPLTLTFELFTFNIGVISTCNGGPEMFDFVSRGHLP